MGFFGVMGGFLDFRFFQKCGLEWLKVLILLGFDDKGDDKGLILSEWQISLIFMGFWSEILKKVCG